MKVFLWRVREVIPFSKGMVSRLIIYLIRSLTSNSSCVKIKERGGFYESASAVSTTMVLEGIVVLVFMLAISPAFLAVFALCGFSARSGFSAIFSISVSDSPDFRFVPEIVMTISRFLWGNHSLCDKEWFPHTPSKKAYT